MEAAIRNMKRRLDFCSCKTAEEHRQNQSSAELTTRYQVMQSRGDTEDEKTEKGSKALQM